MAYPTDLGETYATINPTDKMNASAALNHDTRHNTVETEVAALKAKVGISSSAVVTSLDYKVTNTSSSNPGHKHTLADGATNVTSTSTELNLLSGVTAIKDEDDMASDSSSSLATQQSIKAYVDDSISTSFAIDIPGRRQALCNSQFGDYGYSLGSLQRAAATNGQYAIAPWRVRFVNNGSLPTIAWATSFASTRAGSAAKTLQLTTDATGSGFGVSDFYAICQTVEMPTGANIIFGNTGDQVTLSLYLKSAVAGKKVGVYLCDTSGNNSITGTYFTLTTGWVKYTHTFDTSAYAGTYLELRIVYMWGTTFGSKVNSAGVAETFSNSASGEIDINEPLLSWGSTVLPYTTDSLFNLNRYGVIIPAQFGLTTPLTYNYIGTGMGASSTVALMNCPLPVPMCSGTRQLRVEFHSVENFYIGTAAEVLADTTHQVTFANMTPVVSPQNFQIINCVSTSLTAGFNFLISKNTDTFFNNYLIAEAYL